MKSKKATLAQAVEEGNGIVHLHPEWVARDFLPPVVGLD